MNWIFGKPDEKEQKRRENRELRTATRDLASDYRQLERKEKELEIQIKQLAKSGQNEACKVLARQLVQLRKQKTKNIGASATVSSVSSRTRHAQSMQTMGKVLGKTAQTMGDVNVRLPVQQMAKDMQEFSRQQALMDMKGDIVDETLDSMLDVDEGEEERVIEQVLDEIGIETKEKLSKVPRVRDQIGPEKKLDISDKDLEKLLAEPKG